MITTRFVVYYVLLVVLNFSLGFSPILHRSPNTGKILGNARLPVKSVSLCAKLENELVGNEEKIGKIQSVAAKSMMIAYIVSMCVALPLAMAPPAILHKFNIIKKARREHYSARLGQFCARWLMRVFPFANVSVIPASDGKQEEDPSVWVCNHTSMLDIFFLMAMSKKLRGENARPIKIIYWKQLEENPVNRIFFKSCGFIPIDMAANKAGEANEYDKKGFKSLLKSCKKAFADGFDIGILPEGQLNPTPDKGLQPVFGGAFTLAKMSRRPIRMLAIHGAHRLWHPDENIGMKVTSRKVKLRAYPKGRQFTSADDFKDSFSKIVGYFGAKGSDISMKDLRRYLFGKDQDNQEDIIEWMKGLAPKGSSTAKLSAAT